MTIIRIETDGLITLVESKGTLEEYQRAVDGHIEPVMMPDFHPRFTMVVNEEGAIRNYRLNPVASALAHQPIFGNVIVVDGDELRPLSYESARKMAMAIVQTAWRWECELAL